MDRERKLLYAVMILAIIENVMLFANAQNLAVIPSRTALLQEARQCQEKLLHTLVNCRSPALRCPGKGL